MASPSCRQRGGVPLRRVPLVVGSAPGVGEETRRLGIGIPAALLGVLVGLVADGDGSLVGELPGVLRLGAGLLAQLGRLLLGQGEDLADAVAQVLERERLRGAGLLGSGHHAAARLAASSAAASAASFAAEEASSALAASW